MKGESVSGAASGGLSRVHRTVIPTRGMKNYELTEKWSYIRTFPELSARVSYHLLDHRTMLDGVLRRNISATPRYTARRRTSVGIHRLTQIQCSWDKQFG